VTQIFGVGPVVAATVIGSVRDITRFPGRDHFAAYNAPRRSRCPPATARSTGSRGAGTGASTTPYTWPRSPRSATATATAAPTTTASWPRAKPPNRRRAPSSAGSATPSSPASRPTPGGPPPRPGPGAREGNRGTTLSPARPAHTPHTGSSAKPLPDPEPAYDRPPRAGEPCHRSRLRGTPREPLDAKRHRSVCRAKRDSTARVWCRTGRSARIADARSCAVIQAGLAHTRRPDAPPPRPARLPLHHPQPEGGVRPVAVALHEGSLAVGSVTMSVRLVRPTRPGQRQPPAGRAGVRAARAREPMRPQTRRYR
jgi:hypothetical protein